MDDRSFVAGQSFVLEVKKYWTSQIYPALKDDYEARAGKLPQMPETVAQVAEVMAGSTLYQYYAWFERHLQRFKYSGRYGLVPYHAERRRELMAPLAEVAEDARLELNADLEMPKYYQAVDIHQHPGGVWSDDLDGHVYERGARSTTPLMGAKHRDLHQRFTDLIAQGGSPTRILDMGCGFGKSTRPFCESFADSHIEAIDLSGPCVRFGAHQALKDQAENVRFRQMNAYETDYEDGAFDLVTSTMVIHELPPRQIDAFFDEAYRVMEPGGRMVHLDFHALPDVFTRFLHYSHGRRNNEPFMEPWAEMDVVRALTDKGFRNVSVTPFQEAEGVDVANSPTWRFPWTVISAEK